MFQFADPKTGNVVLMGEANRIQKERDKIIVKLKKNLDKFKKHEEEKQKRLDLK